MGSQRVRHNWSDLVCREQNSYCVSIPFRHHPQRTGTVHTVLEPGSRCCGCCYKETCCHPHPSGHPANSWGHLAFHPSISCSYEEHLSTHKHTPATVEWPHGTVPDRRRAWLVHFPSGGAVGISMWGPAASYVSSCELLGHASLLLATHCLVSLSLWQDKLHRGKFLPRFCVLGDTVQNGRLWRMHESALRQPWRNTCWRLMGKEIRNLILII